MPDNGKIFGLHARRVPRAAKKPRPVETEPEVVSQLPRWITISGLECSARRPGFCNDARGALGKDYFLNHGPTFEALAEAGFDGFRIPFRWEHLQPELGGALDPDGVQQLRYLLSVVEGLERKAVIAMHNPGRYVMRINGEVTSCGIEEPIGKKVWVTSEDLSEFWSRMSHAFAGLPGIKGYSLMNAPHGMAKDTWVRVSQAAVEAIRVEEDDTRVHISGVGSARSSTWAKENPAEPWIDDPANNVVYEANCYLDRDQTGQYELAFEDELARDAKLSKRATTRLNPFLRWLKAGEAQGMISEFGVPCDDPQWVALLPDLLRAFEQAGIQSCWWAAGEHLEEHPLSLQISEEEPRLRPAQAELFRGRSA